MNLPGFRKGDVLLAEDLQALSDAVGRMRGADGAAAAERGPAAWQQGLRTPIRDSGDARLAVNFDNPALTCGGDDGDYLKPLATGYGWLAGAATPICELQGTEPEIVQTAEPEYTGPLWQTFRVSGQGTVVSHTNAYAGEPLPAKWWGEAGGEGDDCEGRVTVLLGCMRCNECSDTGQELNPENRYYFRRHKQVVIPHLTVNAKVDEDVDAVPLVLRHDVKENVSRVKRLAAGVGVQLADEGEVVRIAADGGGLRPVNPPGAVDCACEEDAECETVCVCGAAVRRAVPLVGEEWPAGAPVGVIVRQLVGRAGAVVRRHVPQEGEACCEFRCAVDVVARVPVNAGDAAGSCAVAGVGLVTCEGYHTCCVVPLRRLQAGDGLKVKETDFAVVLETDLAVEAGDAGSCAEPGVCGWVRTFYVEESAAGSCCVGVARRQLMRFNGGQLQVVQQVKRDGIWYEAVEG